jgi:hypothetical protein
MEQRFISQELVMARGRGWRRSLKRFAIVMLLILSAYLLSYGVLSALGRYEWDISGRTRLGTIGLTDCELWQPKGMYFKQHLSVDGTRMVVADLLGYFYAPLICADRAWVHRSHFLFE